MSMNKSRRNARRQKKVGRKGKGGEDKYWYQYPVKLVDRKVKVVKKPREVRVPRKKVRW